MSRPPALVSVLPPKFAAPVNIPVTTMQLVPPLPSQLALRSTAIAVALSLSVPPKRLDHSGAPAGEYLATKTSPAPALVSGAPPKPAVLVKLPVMIMLPGGSTAVAVPASNPVPPPRSLQVTDGAGAGAAEHIAPDVISDTVSTPPSRLERLNQTTPGDPPRPAPASCRSDMTLCPL